MKEITKKAVRFTDISNQKEYEELTEELIGAEIQLDGQYLIQFRHVPNKPSLINYSGHQTYYVNKKTYAKCVQILKERIKKQAKERKND